MGPLALMAIGAAMGAAKNEMSDRPKADAQRLFEAQKAKYSGWTGMNPNHVASPDLFGNMLSGGMGGLAMGQNMKQQDAYNDFLRNQQANQMAASAPSSWQAMNDPRFNNQNYAGTMNS